MGLLNIFKQKKGDFTRIPPSGSVMLMVVRGVFIAIVISLATQFASGSKDIPSGLLVFSVVVILGIIIVLSDILAKHKQIKMITAIYFGLLMGFLLGTLFSMALEPVVQQYVNDFTRRVQLTDEQRSQLVQSFRLVVTIVTCYFSVSVLIQTRDEYRFIIPYVEFSKQVKGGRPLVLDTSVIIDGRIADICDTGAIDSKLIVPRFVLQELQGIADSSDKIKRNRGRRGLDVLKRLQTNDKIELQMHEANLAELRDVPKVDERLVVLAQYLNARVVTNDYNLNKVAQLQGVEVINLNELANAMKLVALPGEQLYIRVIKEGDQVGQGVGYLDDGTMVVIEQGRSAIGKEVDITVTSVLQTPAGRMIFGKLESSRGGGAERGQTGIRTAE